MGACAACALLTQQVDIMSEIFVRLDASVRELEVRVAREEHRLR